MQGLSKRLGFPEFFDFSMDEMKRAQLKPHGLHPDDMVATGVWTNRTSRNVGKTLVEGYRFRTPSGKIQLASERFRRRGYPVLPEYKSPETIPKGQFRLLVGKNAFFTHAANQNNPWLHELMPVNALWLHPKPANERGIEDGDTIRVESPVGSVTVAAFVTERIRPDCVHLPHGFDHQSPAMSRVHKVGGCDSDLIITREDKITGNAALHETLVKVTRVGEGVAS